MASDDILVFRAVPGLGDFLCAVPALRAIRVARPGAAVHLIALESTRPLAERFARYVDRFYPFPGHAGLPELPPPSAATWSAFVDATRAVRADLALQLHGSGETTNEIVLELGASRVAGFVRPGTPAPAAGTFLEWDEAEPEAQRWLRLLRAAGIPASDDRVELPIAPGADDRARRLLGTSAGRAWALVHPGSARLANRWPVEGFEAVARALAGRGLRVVVTGTADEAPLTAAVAAAVPGSLDLAGATGLDELAALVAGARIVVANDTGVAHVASALETPSVVVFQSGDQAHVRRWSPVDGQRHIAVAPPARVEAVLAAVERLVPLERAVA